MVEELRGFCAGICEFIVDQPVDVVAEVEGGRLVLNINHELMIDQITQNAKFAEAMEHVL